MIKESGSFKYVTKVLRPGDPLPVYHPYIGRGLLQITWESNYKDYGRYVGENLLGYPDYEKLLAPHTAYFLLGGFGKNLKG